jgi:hypothetical protein
MPIRISQNRMDVDGKPIRNASTIGIIATPATDLTGAGIITTLTAGANLVFGDVCYLNSSGNALLADADAIATAGAIALSLATISNGNPGNFLLHGVARDDSWNWTPGGLLYLSTTAGAMTQTAPNGTDDVIQVLGVATHADRIYFNPSLVQVEHA